MSIDTNIQWCDSTLNIQMGCEGCELIKGKNKRFPKCYAKIMTDRYGGTNKGFPLVFEEPKIFMDRLKNIKSWKDLTGTIRVNKPWLNNLPRIIFLNDMGDTFSNGMPLDWFAEALPTLAASPHIFMLLTKWPKRMVKFSEKYPFPANIWPGVTVTSQKTAFRAYELAEVKGGGLKWLSIEPMWGPINWEGKKMKEIELLIFGGESGSTNVTRFNCNWLYNQILFCDRYKKSCFIKQLGSNPYLNSKPLLLKDFHGGNWVEWPSQFHLREFPQIDTISPANLVY